MLAFWCFIAKFISSSDVALTLEIGVPTKRFIGEAAIEIYVPKGADLVGCAPARETPCRSAQFFSGSFAQFVFGCFVQFVSGRSVPDIPDEAREMPHQDPRRQLQTAHVQAARNGEYRTNTGRGGGRHTIAASSQYHCGASHPAIAARSSTYSVADGSKEYPCALASTVFAALSATAEFSARSDLVADGECLAKFARPANFAH